MNSNRNDGCVMVTCDHYGVVCAVHKRSRIFAISH